MNGKIFGGRDHLVDLATRYGVDGPGIESPEGARLPVPPSPAPMSTQPSIQWVPCLPGVMRPELVARPPPSSAEIANGWELYLRLPSVPVQACRGVTFMVLPERTNRTHGIVSSILSYCRRPGLEFRLGRLVVMTATSVNHSRCFINNLKLAHECFLPHPSRCMHSQ